MDFDDLVKKTLKDLGKAPTNKIVQEVASRLNKEADQAFYKKVKRSLDRLERQHLIHQEPGEIEQKSKGDNLYKRKGLVWVYRSVDRSRQIPEEHVKNIASGLLSLIQIGKYRVEGELIPRKDYRKFAFQHYPEIADTYDKINYKKGIGLRILTIYDEFANKTLEELEEHGIKANLNNAKDIIDCILKPFDLSNVYSKIDRKIQTKSNESGWAAYCGGRLLFPVKDDKDAEILKRDLKLSISKTMQGNEVLLQELKDSLEQRSNLSNGFREKVEFLINKLLDMGKLDGECDICKNAK